MELEDGGLYETKHGVRFRVHLEDGLFVCRSYGGYWDANGCAHGKVWVNREYRNPHLVTEIVECRWVPVPASYEDWAATPNHLRCSDGRHHQILVDREKARAIGQAGNVKAILARVSAPVPAKSGEVRFQDVWNYTMGFDWKFIDEGGFLEITTTLGDVLKVRV